jgi:hypothetical protein
LEKFNLRPHRVERVKVDDMVLENITANASPSIRLWQQNWSVLLDGTCVGLVRKIEDDYWRAIALDPSAGRPKVFLGVTQTQEQAAKLVRDYYPKRNLD